MVDFNNNIKLPPVLPQVSVPQPSIEEHALPPQSWLFSMDGSTLDFMAGRILMNKQDLVKMIAENLSHLSPSYWSDVSRKLEAYRRWAMDNIKDPEQLALFAAMLHGILTKISGRLKRKFDETVDGIAFYIEEGQLLLNGINVHAFIEMAKRHPTQKARIFLKGLRTRLGLVLGNRGGNTRYDRIRNLVLDLSQQIDEELAKPLQEALLSSPKLPG
ncbi:MAG: hypothetical protein HQM15_04300 [Deltaproteobacteria bacterium]|nr:hypothetical protein [Deltaproteobacteria bacterium]